MNRGYYCTSLVSYCPPQTEQLACTSDNGGKSELFDRGQPNMTNVTKGYQHKLAFISVYCSGHFRQANIYHEFSAFCTTRRRLEMTALLRSRRALDPCEARGSCSTSVVYNTAHRMCEKPVLDVPSKSWQCKPSWVKTGTMVELVENTAANRASKPAPLLYDD